MDIRDRVKSFSRVKASAIRPSPHNWRTHPKAQADALKGLLAELGFAGAVLARELPDGNLEAIDGHLRLDTMGDREVPVLITDLDGIEAKKLLAAFDPIGAMAEADSAKLDALLKEVSTDNEALRSLLDGLAHDNGLATVEPGAGVDEFDATPEATGPTRTKADELWVIGGKHRLLVGDCTDAGNVARLMGGAKAGLCNTDPPYGIAYSDAARVAADRTHVRPQRERTHVWPQRERRWGDNDIENDELDGPALQTFLESYIRAAVPYLTENAAHYMWHPMLTQGTFFAAAAADILIHRQIIWVKPGLLFGFGDYHWQHELCFYGWRKGHRPEFYGERNQTTIWQFGHDTQSGQRDHPTQKPIELFTRPIQNHTKPGEVIYEPFAGSGSQFIAAHRLGRVCYGCEIEPRYADVILKRAEAEGLECVRDE